MINIRILITKYNSIVISVILIIIVVSCNSVGNDGIDIDIPKEIISIQKFDKSDFLIYSLYLEKVDDSTKRITGLNTLLLKYSGDFINLYYEGGYTDLQYGIKRKNDKLISNTYAMYFPGSPVSYNTYNYHYSSDKILSVKRNYGGTSPYQSFSPVSVTNQFIYDSDRIIRFDYLEDNVVISNTVIEYYASREDSNIINSNYYNNIALDLEGLGYKLNPRVYLQTFSSHWLISVMNLEGSFCYLGKKTDYLIRSAKLITAGNTILEVRYTYERNELGQIIRMNQLNGSDELEYYYLFEYAE